MVHQKDTTVLLHVGAWYDLTSFQSFCLPLGQYHLYYTCWEYSKPSNATDSSVVEDGVVRRSKQSRMDNATSEIMPNTPENVTQATKFIYKESLLLTSYPAWGGNAIYHDPTYAVVFIGETPPTSDISKTTNSKLTSIITTTTSPSTGFGFEILFVFVGFGAILAFRKKRKYTS